MQLEIVPLSFIFHFFIHSSWSFYSSRYHSYPAIELAPMEHGHAFHSYHWESGDEDKATMEYSLDDGI
jgi:hypothetical protein